MGLLRVNKTHTKMIFYFTLRVILWFSIIKNDRSVNFKLGVLFLADLGGDSVKSLRVGLLKCVSVITPLREFNPHTAIF